MVSVGVYSSTRSGSARWCARVRSGSRILRKNRAEKAGRPSGKSWGCREKNAWRAGADAPIQDRRGDCLRERTESSRRLATRKVAATGAGSLGGNGRVWPGASAYPARAHVGHRCGQILLPATISLSPRARGAPVTGYPVTSSATPRPRPLHNKRMFTGTEHICLLSRQKRTQAEQSTHRVLPLRHITRQSRADNPSILSIWGLVRIRVIWCHRAIHPKKHASLIAFLVYTLRLSDSLIAHLLNG
jgi:hypothetical protein